MKMAIVGGRYNLKKEINIRWICLVGDVWFAKLMKVNGWYVCQGRWKIWEKSLMHEMQSISWSQKIFQSKKKMLYISMTKITMIEMLKTMK